MIYIQVNAVGVALKVLENTVFLGRSVTLNLVYVPNGLLTEAVCMHFSSVQDTMADIAQYLANTLLPFLHTPATFLDSQIKYHVLLQPIYPFYMNK